MSSHKQELCRTVLENCERARIDGYGTLQNILPVTFCRELQPTESKFVRGSDPIVQSYFSQKRNQRFRWSPIDRKIESGVAVHIVEGILDNVFPNQGANLYFVGDSDSDKRLIYNTDQLLSNSAHDFPVCGFISNNALVTAVGQSDGIKPGWDSTGLYYHGASWDELEKLLEKIDETPETENKLCIFDLDGTTLCPRPEYTSTIAFGREEALIQFAGQYFDSKFFDPDNASDVAKLRNAFKEAARTTFCKSFDDADLTALVALAIFAGIFEKDHQLLNPKRGLGFVKPIEFLQFAIFVMETHGQKSRHFDDLRSLFVECADTARSGAPSFFHGFRCQEEKVLLERTKRGDVVINKHIVSFLIECAKRGVVPIGFSDRPNASLGLEECQNGVFTCAPKPGVRLFTKALPLG